MKMLLKCEFRISGDACKLEVVSTLIEPRGPHFDPSAGKSLSFTRGGGNAGAGGIAGGAMVLF